VGTWLMVFWRDAFWQLGMGGIEETPQGLCKGVMGLAQLF